MTIQADDADAIAALDAVCREIGWGRVVPTILRRAHHLTVAIPSHRLVARIQSHEPVALARNRATKELAVTRFLADRGAPVVAPIAEHAGPHIQGRCVLTFWSHLDRSRPATERDAKLAARSLAAIHLALGRFAQPLPPFTDALDRCWALLSGTDTALDLAADDRALLKAEFRRLRGLVEAAGVPRTPLHGDAHLGNVLRERRDIRWLDFEDACLGPREYDAAALPGRTWRYFPDLDPALLVACTALRSVCVATWCSAAAPGRSVEVREAARYHLAEVRRAARRV